MLPGPELESKYGGVVLQARLMEEGADGMGFQTLEVAAWKKGIGAPNSEHCAVIHWRDKKPADRK